MYGDAINAGPLNGNGDNGNGDNGNDDNEVEWWSDGSIVQWAPMAKTTMTTIVKNWNYNRKIKK